MSRVKDPGAHTKQAEGFRGDAAAVEIRALLARLRPEPQPEPEPERDVEGVWAWPAR